MKKETVIILAVAAAAGYYFFTRKKPSGLVTVESPQIITEREFNEKQTSPLEQITNVVTKLFPKKTAQQKAERKAKRQARRKSKTNVSGCLLYTSPSPRDS